MDGCIDRSIAPEAIIPWDNVREIEAGNWVLWFKLREPVVIASDRGKRKKVHELKAYFHGGPSGDLTYYYNLEYEGHIPFWNIDVYRVDNLRGIAVGPNEYQRRLQYRHRQRRRPGAPHHPEAQRARRGMVSSLPAERLRAFVPS